MSARLRLKVGPLVIDQRLGRKAEPLSVRTRGDRAAIWLAVLLVVVLPAAVLVTYAVTR